MSLDTLVDMGFPRAVAQRSLVLCNGDLSASIEMCCKNPPPLDGNDGSSHRDPSVDLLVAMGFTAHAAGQALCEEGGDVERAVSRLTSHSARNLHTSASTDTGILDLTDDATPGPTDSTTVLTRVTEHVSHQACQDNDRIGGGERKRSRRKGKGSQDVEVPPPERASGSSACAESAAATLRLTVSDAAAQYDFGLTAFGPLRRRDCPTSSGKNLHGRVPKLITDSYPEAEHMRGQRNEKYVTQMLADCYHHGLFTFGPAEHPLNQQLIPALRHIFCEMAKLSSHEPKRVTIMTTLAMACQDCQMVQAREILRIYGDLTSRNETFEDQLRYSLVRQKEAALNVLITKRHKATCDLDHTQVRPGQQRPHLVSAYVDLLGDSFGFDGVTAARSDRFLEEARREIGKKVNVKELETELRGEMSVKEWLQTLLADINNQSDSPDRLIDRGLIFKWVEKNLNSETAYKVFYDEDRVEEFKDQDPEKPTKKNEFEPFLSCSVLVDMLLKAGLLCRASESVASCPSPAKCLQAGKRPRR